MDRDVRLAIDRIKCELQKDVRFFAACGAAVGIVMVWQYRIKELGWADDPRLASNLLTDFVSIHAFTFIFLAYLLIACCASALSAVGSPNQRLEQLVGHVESRFVQVASAIMSFMSGLVAFVLLYSVVRLDSGGLRLVLISALLIAFVFVTSVMAILVGRRSAPFNHWAGATFMLIVLVAVFGWLLVQSERPSANKPLQPIAREDARSG